MKAKLTTVLAVTFTVVFVTAAFAVASAGATQVTSRHAVTVDKVPETNPDLSGANLVWQEKPGNDWNIYYADGLAGPGTAICSNPGDQILPRVSVGSNGHVLVVWEDHRNGNADIYGYDVTAGKAFTVCDDPSQQVAPRISGDWVVWQDKRNGNWEIYGATIDPTTDTVGPATALDPEAYDQTEPDVSGNIVVWVDTRYGDQDIMGYDRAVGPAGFVFPICINDAVQDQPAVSGNTVVWRDARNAATSGTDIYGYDLRTSREFAVCTAAGDQSSPAVDQDLVVWSDARSAASGLDVRGYDLTLQQEFPVVTAPAWQGQPTVSDYRVVWTDARNGGIADLWAAVLTPWNAGITIDGGRAWTRSATASLALFAQGKTGIVTTMTIANAGGPAGTPEDYWPVKSPWYLTPGDGRKTVTVTYTDISHESSPTVSASVTLDTHGPTIRVPAAASVKRGATASIGYRVTDNLSPRVAVTIRLLNKHGNIVKVFMVGKARTGTALHHLRFVCKLKTGSYKVRVWATDLAGNHQVKVGANTLTVK